MFDRTWRAPEGRHGGMDGTPGKVSLASGKTLRSKGRQSIPQGDRIVLELPGGGGYGPPGAREAEKVREDVADDLITREAAKSDYGVVLTENLEIDTKATSLRRRQ